MNVEEKEIQEGIEEKEQVASLAEQTEKKEGPSLDLILDIPLEVTVELGSTKILVKDLLKLGQGSILELNKLASEPLEVLINGRLIAKGEV
ncbi:MAG: FliM/FliN family flagellar motor switch protein, partial [Thermodesulfobacteriota bacterium]|nr:FliM/FliN family flagellar motor switch protein [Thermodesulfobacteriota bacterium]